jgi:hypothetical protein
MIDTAFTCTIQNLLFSLDSISSLDNPFILASGFSNGGNTGLFLNSVIVNYPFEMTHSSLMSASRSRFTFTNLEVYFSLRNTMLERGGKGQRNAGENICASQSNYYPVLYINSNSNGLISNSVFENSQTGALLIEDSDVTITSTTFRNNIIFNLYSSPYPNLRFNICVRGSSLVEVNSMITDTPGAYWIYNNGMGIIGGDESISRSPLFTPRISVVSQGKKAETGEIVVNFIGTLLFPCYLSANFIINNDSSTTQQTGFEVVGVSETYASVNIPGGLFNRTGEYYIFLTFGVDNLQKTESFHFYSVSGSGSSEDGLSKGGSNSAAVVVLVVIVVVVVVVLLVIVVVFVLVYRRRQRLRGSGAGHGSKAQGGLFSEDLSRSKKYEKSSSGGFGDGDGDGDGEGGEVENFDENYDEDQEQGLLEDLDEE